MRKEGQGFECRAELGVLDHGCLMNRKCFITSFNVCLHGLGAFSRIIRTLAAVVAASLMLTSVVNASVSDVVRGRLLAAGWGAAALDALLEVHAEEFEFDARSGWLSHRLEFLARLGRHPTALRMVENFPEYADLFANAAEPNSLAQVIGDLSADRTDRGRLLNLFIGWRSRSEIEHLHRVLERHGSTVMVLIATEN